MSLQEDLQLLKKLKNDYLSEDTLYQQLGNISTKIQKPAPYYNESAHVVKTLFSYIGISILASFVAVVGIFIIFAVLAFIWGVFGSNFWDWALYYLFYIFAFIASSFYGSPPTWENTDTNGIAFLVQAFIGLSIVLILCSIIGLVIHSKKVSNRNLLGYYRYKRACEEWESQDFEELQNDYNQCSRKLRLIQNAIQNNNVLGSQYKSQYVADVFLNYFQNRRADSIKEATNLYEQELRDARIMRQQQEALAEQRQQTEMIKQMQQDMDEEFEIIERNQRTIAGVAGFAAGVGLYNAFKD